MNMDNDGVRSQKRPPRLFRELVHEYQWIHLGLGLIGNISFVIGSIFFLWESYKTDAIWLFIIGSFGMLVGSVGSAIVKYDKSEDPHSGKIIKDERDRDD